MSFDPWSIPHDCERAEVADRLNRLSANQRKVVRSYVRHVEFGEMKLSEWIAQDKVPRVSLSTWRQRADKKGNYWGTEDSPNLLFRDAVAAYITAMGRWQTEEEAKTVRQANRELRLASLTSARRVINLVDNGENDRVKLDAAKDVLNRASEETAEKSNVAVHSLSADTFAAMRQQASKEAEEIEDEALREWES